VHKSNNSHKLLDVTRASQWIHVIFIKIVLSLKKWAEGFSGYTRSISNNSVAYSNSELCIQANKTQAAEQTS
jgi:hypothetical protein